MDARLRPYVSEKRKKKDVLSSVEIHHPPLPLSHLSLHSNIQTPITTDVLLLLEFILLNVSIFNGVYFKRKRQSEQRPEI